MTLPGLARRALAPAAVVLSLLAAIDSLGQAAPAWPPERLQDTGLYSDWTTRTIGADKLPFSPQYPLWTDGAAKSRWMHIPPGKFIDATNPDVWRFPVGTRFWKEFRFARRAETRFIEHTRTGWQFATYVWSEDGSEATLAPETGIRYSVPINDDVRHAIPSRTDCRACHEAGPVRALGVTALQLSTDRDPNAPHAECRLLEPSIFVAGRTWTVAGTPGEVVDGAATNCGIDADGACGSRLSACQLRQLPYGCRRDEVPRLCAQLHDRRPACPGATGGEDLGRKTQSIQNRGHT